MRGRERRERERNGQTDKQRQREKRRNKNVLDVAECLVTEILKASVTEVQQTILPTKSLCK